MLNFSFQSILFRFCVNIHFTFSWFFLLLLNLCFLYILKCSFICVTSRGSFSVLNLNEPHLYPCVSSFLVNSYASITLWLHPDVLYVFIETNIGTVSPPWPHPLLAFL